MGKSRPSSSKTSRRTAHAKTLPSPPPPSAPALLAEASALLQTGQPDLALDPCTQAAALLSPNNSPTRATLPALYLLGEIHIELGDPISARETFLMAAQLDPDGMVPEVEGGGAEKFMWLAQLAENAGRESLGWFEKGVECLESGLAQLQGKRGAEEELEDKKRKLASALCGMVEIWMTDLSFEDEAEANCENLITRAMVLSEKPYSSVLQTLASIRLSQARLEDAQSALARSMEQWKDLPPEHVDVPEFPARISLTRLLMEAQMEDVALEVVERLVGEDDESIEAWYLGGWCLWLMSEKIEAEDEDDKKERIVLRMSSREWLRNCLKLYTLLEYEDERLRDHAQELADGLEKELGDAEIEDDDAGEDWEDDEDEESEKNEDHDMNGT